MHRGPVRGYLLRRVGHCDRRRDAEAVPADRRQPGGKASAGDPLEGEGVWAAGGALRLPG